MSTRTQIFALLFFVPFVITYYFLVGAASLIRVSDTISTSIPSATSTHTIRFTTNQAIPISGKIVVTPHAGAFTIPSDFNYTDVDLATSNGGGFTDRDLAASASLGEDGVAIVAGALGSVTITLNSTSGIAAGEEVIVELGTNATHGALGNEMIINPSTVGSYRIDVATRNSSNASLDSTRAMIAIIAPVRPNAVGENLAPTRVLGLPSGEIAAGNDEVEISLATDEIAFCRYATTPGVEYDSMTEDFQTAGRIIFYTTLSGFENNTSYTYYVRCIDSYGTVNSDDYPITFNLATTPISNTSISSGNSSGTGTGPIPGGSAVLFLASVTISGLSSPQSTVTILKDGATAASTVAGSDGVFSSRIAGLERGVYTFLTYATDRAGRKSAAVSSTITLGQGTTNTVANFILPPTLALQTVYEPGTVTRIVGESVPGSAVEVFAQQVGSASEKKYTATSNASSGEWFVEIPAADIRGATVVRARGRTEDRLSDLSAPLSIAGEAGSAIPAGGGDMNGDAKVNLVDFSILLSAWGTANANSDLNSDGTVNLADFSILLFNWTG